MYNGKYEVFSKKFLNNCDAIASEGGESKKRPVSQNSVFKVSSVS